MPRLASLLRGEHASARRMKGRLVAERGTTPTCSRWLSLTLITATLKARPVARGTFGSNGMSVAKTCVPCTPLVCARATADLPRWVHRVKMTNPGESHRTLTGRGRPRAPLQHIVGDDLCEYAHVARSADKMASGIAQSCGRTLNVPRAQTCRTLVHKASTSDCVKHQRPRHGTSCGPFRATAQAIR